MHSVRNHVCQMQIKGSAEVLLSSVGEGEEDFTDSDSVITGADSPELADSVPDKDNMR